MAIVQGPTVHRYNSTTQGNNTIHGHCTNTIIWFKNLRVNNRQNLIRLLYIYRGNSNRYWYLIWNVLAADVANSVFKCKDIWEVGQGKFFHYWAWNDRLSIQAYARNVMGNEVYSHLEGASLSQKTVMVTLLLLLQHLLIFTLHFALWIDMSAHISCSVIK